MSSQCPVCENPRTTAGPVFDDLATFLFPMDADQASAVERRNFVLEICRDCSHVFQPEVDQHLLQKIYGEYYRYYPYGNSPEFSPAYREPFDKLFERCVGGSVKAGARLLEIGCSDAENLAPYAQLGFDCTGIDPSPLAGDSRTFENTRIVSGFYEEHEFDGQFDVVLSKFVAEHVVDLSHHVRRIAKDTAENGMVFVQVPNLMYYVNESQPFFAAHEHVHYFTLRSLSALFARFGLKLVGAGEEARPSIIACFSNRSDAVELGDAENPEVRVREFFDRTAELAESARAVLAESDEVILYGAGLLFWWIIELAGDPRKVRVIDDNEGLQGLSMPSFGNVVEKPHDVLAACDAPVVLTLNPMYHDKVLLRIEDQFPGRIVYGLGSDGLSRRVVTQ